MLGDEVETGFSIFCCRLSYYFKNFIEAILYIAEICTVYSIKFIKKCCLGNGSNAKGVLSKVHPIGNIFEFFTK